MLHKKTRHKKSCIFCKNVVAMALSNGFDKQLTRRKFIEGLMSAVTVSLSITEDNPLIKILKKILAGWPQTFP